MGNLVKNHLARLVILSAAFYHCAASLESFFWPKIFFDFQTKNLDSAIKPIPILQSINMTMGVAIIAWEWPLGLIAGTAIHRSIKARVMILPLAAFAALLLYQATNPALYYMIGTGLYIWAQNEDEVVVSEPWTLPASLEGGLTQD